MSEGEVEVASTTNEVLPKEVLAEVGSVKLFSTSNPRISATSKIRIKNRCIATVGDFSDPLLTVHQLQTAGATRMSRFGTSP